MYDRLFQKVTHKVGFSSMNYIKIFQNAQNLSVLIGNSYSWDHLMHTFLDKLHQGVKHTVQISIHQAGLRGEGNFTHQKYLYITSLQNDYFNLDISSGPGRNNERPNPVQAK